MPFSNPTLLAAIAAACREKTSGKRALGHNVRYEERLTPERVALFEQPPSLPATPDGEGLRGAQTAYFEERIRLGRNEVADTFLPENAGATLAGLDETQTIVRMEEITWVTAPSAARNDRRGRIPFEVLQKAVDLVRESGSGDSHPEVKKARAAVTRFLGFWNRERYRPPTFVGFLSEVDGDADAADWPERLRCRFGLRHFDVPRGGGALDMIQLRYTVGDVLRQARKRDIADRAFAVPMALDGRPSSHFFPAPLPARYGRTLNLERYRNCRPMCAEIIHYPIDYGLRHVHKIGRLETPIPAQSFRELRNGHLHCLRDELNRPDFGEEMPSDVAD